MTYLVIAAFLFAGVFILDAWTATKVLKNVTDFHQD